MPERPVLKTKRLILRPFTWEDTPSVKRLAGDRAIADTTLFIPHPYEDGMAEEWISKHQEEFDGGEVITYAIAHREDKLLIGAIALSEIKKHDETASMGYWIGKPFWNQGYGTEAAHAVLKYGFEVLNLNKIHAHHFKRNPASGKIMQKIGMKHEGCLRQHIKKWDKFEDLEVYGILRDEFFDS